MSKKITAEQRRKALRDRTKTNVKNKDKGGRNGRRVLDFSKVGEVNFYKPEEGTNKIDIIPYIIKTDNHPQREEAGMEKGYEDYLLDIWVHSFVGPMEESFLCLKKTFGKPCPICEEAALMRKNGEDEDEVKALKPSRRVFYNVIDVDDRDKGIQIFESSHYLFEKELLEEAESNGDGEIITFADIEEGSTIAFRAAEETGGKYKYLKFKSFKFKERKENYEEDILEESYSLDELMVIPVYEDVHNAFHGIADDESENSSDEPDDESDDEPDDKDEDPPKRKRGNKKEGKKNKCPEGYKFGEDVDDYKECKKCELWDECVDANED